ncbi:hypothetical protein AVEN_247253-1 [Araneus ventricosus]|uniref:Uncharacterized protein n=1 Tax=Araneus ventricosus TaxID=182803 RepID=A0A4Y2QN17_ARAVE|nr:hypothetical protein AVEN_145732-1 [Araneus ventricosus]GBN64678.1 hypothetical protein AVEN_75295-1 [Araneus ventricosus]GBN66667.1 hypothetical protein AVEN_46345-1 [Araneus ventricosus]GBN67447.1 hypothetical protein AVEN_247253-1 [Araneus ventricosus]
MATLKTKQHFLHIQKKSPRPGTKPCGASQSPDHRDSNTSTMVSWSMAFTGPCTNHSLRRYIPSLGCGRHRYTTSTISTKEARPRLLIRWFLIHALVVTP